MDVFDLMAKLSLDSSEYEAGLGGAEKQAQGFGSKVKSFLGTAAKVGGAALGAASGAALAFAKSSVDAGMSFDSSMSQVAATMGITVEELSTQVGTAETSFGHFEGTLRDFAQFMGSNTAFSATEAADALNYMALAGYDAQTSMEMLPNVLSLAAAGNMDLARASDMVTDAQSALGLSLDETSHLVDVMAKTSSTTNTSVEQLGDALLTVGGTAKNLKGGTAELSQVLGLLADNGIKGSEGGTALRNVILSLSAPTDKAAEALANLGVKVFDEKGNMRDLQSIFEDLNGSLSKLNQGQQTQVLNEIFNKVDLKSVNALLGTSSARWEQVADAIDKAEGAAAQMAATQLDNLAGDVTLFQSALEGAKIAVSDRLTPTLRTFVQFGTNSISDLTEAFQKDGLTGALDALDEIIKEGITIIFNALPTVLNAGARLLESLISGIIENLPALVSAAEQVIFTIASMLLNPENISKLIDSAFEITMMLADGLIDALPTLVPAIVEIIMKIVEKLTDPEMVMRMIDAAFQILIALGKGIINALPKVLESVGTIVQNIGTTIERAFPQILQRGKELVLKLREGISAKAEEISIAFRNMIDNIRTAIEGVVSTAWNWGRDLIQNFINGIVQQAQALWNTLVNIGQGIRNLIGFSEPKEGPLSNFSSYAPDMMKLFAKGIEDNKGMLLNTVADAFDFGGVTVESAKNSSGNAPVISAGREPIIIRTFVYLDRRQIGEAVAEYKREQMRAFG